MGKDLPATRFDEVVIADDDLKDLVASFREDYDFGPMELVLMSLVADPGFEGRRGPTAYADRMTQLGIVTTPARVSRILRNPKFRSACDRVIGDLIVDAGMWDVFKNMVQKAADPKDPHSVQAARLLFQATGKLKTNNDPIHTPETDPFARLVHQVKGTGRVSIHERRIELEVADGSPDAGSSSPGEIEASSGGAGDGDTFTIENGPCADDDGE